MFYFCFSDDAPGRNTVVLSSSKERPSDYTGQLVQLQFDPDKKKYISDKPLKDILGTFGVC